MVLNEKPLIRHNHLSTHVRTPGAKSPGVQAFDGGMGHFFAADFADYADFGKSRILRSDYQAN